MRAGIYLDIDYFTLFYLDNIPARLTTIHDFRHALQARNAGHSVHELKKFYFSYIFLLGELRKTQKIVKFNIFLRFEKKCAFCKKKKSFQLAKKSCLEIFFMNFFSSNRREYKTEANKPWFVLIGRLVFLQSRPPV